LNFDDTAQKVIKNNELVFKLVYDFNGRYEIKGSSQSSTAGIGFGGEYYHYISDSFGAGCGLLVQNQRSAGDISGSFSFIPVYLSLKIRICGCPIRL
jgi:hypothetical protein